MKKSKKTFKRVLAVALAALMVGSSLPIASFATESPKLTGLNKAITAYETKMNGTVYTKMKPAYEAYIAALKVRDAVFYGDDADTTVDTAATNLTNATNAMTAWDPSFTSAVPSFGNTTDGGDSDASVYVEGQTHENIVYTPKCGSSAGGTTDNSGGSKVDFKICYPNTVLVYDGINTPKMPIMYLGVNNNEGGGDVRYVYGAYPSVDGVGWEDNADFTLDSFWRGSHEGGNEGDVKTPNKMDFTRYYTNCSVPDWHVLNGSGYSHATGYVKPTSSNRGSKFPGFYKKFMWSTPTYYKRFESNVMSFTGKLADTEYQKEFILPWAVVTGGMNGVQSSGQLDARIDRHLTTDRATIYVLNTAVLNNTIKSMNQKFDLQNIEKVTTNSAAMIEYLNQMDLATAFRAEQGDYSNVASMVNTKANEIQLRVRNLNNLVAPQLDAAPTGYANLREAIVNSKSTFTAGSTGYTPETWATFEAAYNAALANMKALDDSGSYANDSDANTLATNLNNAKAGLQTVVEKVDTTELEKVLENADVTSVIKAFLKAANPSDDFETVYAALQKAMSDAKIAVWGTVEDYKNAAKALDLSEGNTAIVNEQARLVGEALVKVSINFDSLVPGAENQSMNALLAKAAALNPGDYANFATLNEAVNNAEAFKAQGGLFKSEKGSVVTVVRAYTDKTKALNNAIKNLQPGFSKIQNGTVINPGRTIATKLNDQNNKRPWNLGTTYQDEMVFFRIDHTPFAFDLGSAILTFESTTGYPQVLDSININDPTDNAATGVMHDLAKGEITSARTGRDGIALKDAGKDLTPHFPGGLTLDVTSGGTTGTFQVTDVRVTSTKAAIQGRDANGDIALGVDHNWAPELALTNGVYAYRGGVEAAPNSPTNLVAKYQFSVPASDAQTLSAATVPSTITFAPQNVYWGAVTKWQVWAGTADWEGYGHERKPWAPKITIVDVSYLFELADICGQLNSSDYTTETFNALTQALTAANNTLNYGNMSAQEITAECVTRYNNLWTAYSNLKEAPKHVHQWGEWKSNNDGTHTRTCVAAGCTSPAASETDNCNMVKQNTVAPTCTEKGYTNYKCSVCGYIEPRDFVNATGHQNLEYIYNGSKPDSNTHQVKCADCQTVIRTESCTVVTDAYVAPTAQHPVGKTAGSHCSVCKEVIVAQTDLDATPYFNALEQAKSTMNDPDYNKTFTDEARKIYEDAIKDNTLDFTAPKSKEDIDAATDAILQAKTDLDNAPKGYTVKLQPVVNGVVGVAKEVAVDQVYATAYTVDATAIKGSNFIERWEICDDSAQSVTPIYSGADTVQFTITGDTTVKVYISEKPVESQNYTKVTLYNQYGKVYNVSYVGDNDINALKQQVQNKDLTLTINGNKIKAPSLPFYNVNGWVVKSSPSGEYNLKPEYTFISESASYSQIIGVNGAKINGLDQVTAKYDSRIHLTGGQAYAIVKNGDASQVLTYINSADFIHTPHNSKVYVAIVNKADATNNASSAVTGTLITDKSAQYGEGFKGASFNCMFNVPADAKFVECGAVGTMNQTIAGNGGQFTIGNANVFQAKSYTLSDKNEYTINFISNFAPGTVFYGRSYVKYIDASGQPQTVYGNTEQITL